MKLAKHKEFASFLDDLTPEERSICLYLKDLLQEHFPELSITWAYGVPYYRGQKRICFMYPASMPYSGIAQGVNLGLVKGYLLSNEHQLIQMGDRKEVGYLHLQRMGQIPVETLLEILHEAILLDQSIHKPN